MATRYFRKFSPNVKLFVKATGKQIHFIPIGDFGYIRSDDSQIQDDPKILAEIDVGIKNEVGGVQEITFAQYDAAIKKKELNPSSPAWRTPYREEIRAGTPLDTLGVRVNAPVAAVNPAPESSKESVSSPPVRSLRERANLGTR